MAGMIQNSLQSLRASLGGAALIERAESIEELKRSLTSNGNKFLVNPGKAVNLADAQSRHMEALRLGSYPVRLSNASSSRPAQRGPIIIPDRPSIDMLKHMVAPELVEGNGRQALAIEAEDLLGYTPLRKDAGAPSKLQRLLAALEIEVFEQATVDAYRDKMREHFQARADKQTNAINKRPGLPPWEYYRMTAAWTMHPLESYGKPVPEFVIRKCLEIKKHAPEAKFFVDELSVNAVPADPFMVVSLSVDEVGEPSEDLAYIEVWDEPEFEKAL